MMFAVDWIDEKRPAILQIRRHHHADDAEYQLTPARCIARARGCRHPVSCCHISHTFLPRRQKQRHATPTLLAADLASYDIRRLSEPPLQAAGHTHQCCPCPAMRSGCKAPRSGSSVMTIGDD